MPAESSLVAGLRTVSEGSSSRAAHAVMTSAATTHAQLDLMLRSKPMLPPPPALARYDAAKRSRAAAASGDEMVSAM
jgi:hypothetical protein